MRLLILLAVVVLLPVVGQSQVRLVLRGDTDAWRASTEFTDTAGMHTALRNWRAEQQRETYYEASVDSLARRDTVTYVASLHRGPAHTWAELRAPPGSEQRRWLRRAGYRPSAYATGRPLRAAGWAELRDSTLSRAANAGYPFASIGLDSIDWAAPGELTARIGIETGPLIRIGGIRYDETARVREIFLQRYLGLTPGEAYRGRRIRRINQRLGMLPYLTVNGPPKITFEDSLAFIDLPIRKRTASRFDFVLGVLPGSGPNGGILFTGDLSGELYNGFGQGERLLVNFEQLRPMTQELDLLVDYPYVLGLPFGVEGELDLYRRDTSFLNLNWRLAATYLREGNDRLSFFWENRRTIVPGQTQESIEGAGRLPDTLGVSRSFFGIGVARNRTDRRFSPRRGYQVEMSVAAGFRNLQNVPSADSIRNGRGQLKLEGQAAYYLPAFRGTVLYAGLRGAALFGSGTVLPNEQYRLGGANLLRGFDEQFFFARDYLVATLELRLLLGGNAYLYAFADAGRLNRRNQAEPNLAIDYPTGYGAGVNFETRAGIFGLSLALARSAGIPLDIGNPKVHLGYLSVF